MMTAGIIRVLLVVDIIAMAILALVFLRQRRMNWLAYLGWGLIAVAVPVLGPFFIIAKRPGVWDPSYSLGSDMARLGCFLRRVLPEPVRKTGRLRRNRLRKALRQNR